LPSKFEILRNILNSQKASLAGRLFFQKTAALGGMFLFASWMTSTHFLPWISWHNEVLAFASMLAMSSVVIQMRWADGWSTVLLPRVVWPIGLLITVVAIQFAIGEITFLGDAAILFFYLVLCMLSMQTGYFASTIDESSPFSGANLVEKFAVLMVLGSCASVFVALAQTLDIWEPVTGWIVRAPNLRRPGSNLGQPNQLATLLAIGMASIVYLYEARKVSAVPALFLVAILIVGVTLTESRTGILSCVLLAAWLLVWGKKAGLTTSPWIVALGCVVLFGLLWGWPYFFTYLQSGGMPGGEVVPLNSSGGTRRIVWLQLMDAVLKKPWFGWGLLGVSKAHNAVLDHYVSAEPFSYAHNIILDMAVGMGLPLTLLFVSVGAVWLWRRVCATKSLMPWYCLAVMLPFGVHSMSEFPFAYAYFLVPVMFAVGMLEATLAPNNVVLVGRWPAALGFSLVTVLMAWSVVEYIAIEEDFRIVRFEALHVGQTPSDYERPKIYLLTQLDALLEAGRIVPEPDMAPERIELSRKVAMRYPWTATQNRYALSLALNGNAQEAVRQLKVMRAMHGEKTYESIKANWTELANTKYPQLKVLALP
jgi:O-antigen ligase